MKLSKEEKDLLELVESGEWKQIPEFERLFVHMCAFCATCLAFLLGPGCYVEYSDELKGFYPLV